MVLSKEQDPYRALADAIILQAVDDYRKALAGGGKSRTLECERFFRAGWFRILTSINGSALITKIRAEFQK